MPVPGDLAIAGRRTRAPLVVVPSALIERIGLSSVATPGTCLFAGSPSICTVSSTLVPISLASFDYILVVWCGAVRILVLQSRNKGPGTTFLRYRWRPRSGRLHPGMRRGPGRIRGLVPHSVGRLVSADCGFRLGSCGRDSRGCRASAAPGIRREAGSSVHPLPCSVPLRPGCSRAPADCHQRCSAE